MFIVKQLMNILLNNKGSIMEFKNDIELALYIKNLGGDLYLVGGAVRDYIMGVIPVDYDYVITGVDIDDLPFYKIVGIDFAVFLVRIGDTLCEVALARTEKKIGTGYHGFSTLYDSSVKIKDDLKRRDFTINSMARHILTSDFYDPFCGRYDIKYKLIRHTSDAFREDPLRVYRAARFAAKLGFGISSNTRILMSDMYDEIKDIKPERVWKEIEKLLKYDKPGLFFRYLLSSELLGVHFPEVELLNVPDMHDETAFNHTMTVMDHGKTPMERWGLLCHDLGKGLTEPSERPKHHSHDKYGVPQVEALCERLRAPSKYLDFGIMCVKNHMKFKRANEMRDGKFLRWVSDMGIHYSTLSSVSFIDSAYRSNGTVEETDIHFIPVIAKIVKVHSAMRCVTGKMLIDQGYEQGPKLGDILFQKRVEFYKGLL